MTEMGFIFFALVILVILIGVVSVFVLAFCGIYWGVVKSAEIASEAWKQRAEARQDQKWQAWREMQNPMTSLLRASDADINTPDMLVRPAIAEAEAKPEELLRPIDEDSQDITN